MRILDPESDEIEWLEQLNGNIDALHWILKLRYFTPKELFLSEIDIDIDEDRKCGGENYSGSNDMNIDNDNDDDNDVSNDKDIDNGKDDVVNHTKTSKKRKTTAKSIRNQSITMLDDSNLQERKDEKDIR